MNPYEYVKAVNSGKDIMLDDLDEKAYNGFLVNRNLSYFHDTVLIANEMNRMAHVGGRLQFDFLLNTVRKKKRFSKWAKASKPESLEIVKEYYGYSNDKARQIMHLITPEHLSFMEQKLYKGGKKPNSK
jgi:hypothetical protein